MRCPLPPPLGPFGTVPFGTRTKACFVPSVGAGLSEGKPGAKPEAKWPAAADAGGRAKEDAGGQGEEGEEPAAAGRAKDPEAGRGGQEYDMVANYNYSGKGTGAKCGPRRSHLEIKRCRPRVQGIRLKSRNHGAYRHQHPSHARATHTTL